MVTWQCEAVSSTCGGRIPIGASLLDRSMAATTLPRDGVRPADCRTCPTLRNLFPILLPRFLQFPHSSRHLLLPFGTRQGKVRSFGPSNLSPHFFLLFPSTSTLSIHRGPAFHTPRTSFAPFTPSVNAPGDQRGRGTRCFHLPGAPRHKTTIRHRLRR